VSGNLAEAAAEGFATRVADNPYPGRGLVLGRADDGAWLQIYWIMGRSENSRNRRFVAEGGELRTEPVDLSAVEDPSLIIYRAMGELPGRFVVSNGDQTDTILEGLSAGEGFELSLAKREREPDAPNYTPRISGLIDFQSGTPALALSVLSANRADPALTDRNGFRPAAPPRGYGRALTTYEGDGDPLPPFRGEPLWFPVGGSPEQLLERYWAALDPENRVALAVKAIAADGGERRILVRNRHR
jgi:hypothetical protein